MHELTLTGIRTTLNDNRTQYLTGYHDGRQANIHATRLGFATRALNLAMLNGEHRFPDLNRAELAWNVVFSVATRDEPDRRDAVWSDSVDNGRARRTRTSTRTKPAVTSSPTKVRRSAAAESTGPSRSTTRTTS